MSSIDSPRIGASAYPRPEIETQILFIFWMRHPSVPCAEIFRFP
jgi:hypothetical protein